VEGAQKACTQKIYYWDEQEKNCSTRTGRTPGREERHFLSTKGDEYDGGVGKVDGLTTKRKRANAAGCEEFTTSVESDHYIERMLEGFRCGRRTAKGAGLQKGGAGAGAARGTGHSNISKERETRVPPRSDATRAPALKCVARGDGFSRDWLQVESMEERDTGGVSLISYRILEGRDSCFNRAGKCTTNTLSAAY